MILLSRATPNGRDGTFGLITQDGQPLCVTVERPWLGNQEDISCIPAGVYRFAHYQSPTKGLVWLGQNIPSRDEVEIHAANLASQLKGCIAVGASFADFNGVMGITSSQATLARLLQVLPATFDLTITG